MRSLLANIAARPEEVAAPRRGDDLVPDADVVMDRAFTLDCAPELVWPWLVQLGKHRAGWYLPRAVERLIPTSRRAIRFVSSRWQDLHVGDIIPDYGGRHETFEVALVEPPSTLVYRSRRGHVEVSWAITLTLTNRDAPERPRTRVHLRLRLGSLRRPWLARTGGELVDLLTVAGLAAGLRERLASES